MKKLLLVLFALTSVSLSVSAQNFRGLGFSLGADRDTLLYIIASPFDNWYLSLGGGVQTFIGNELDAEARRNKIRATFSAEIGKWLIPDLAVSLRLSAFKIDGQTYYGLHPFVDRTSDTPTDHYHIDAYGNKQYYYPFSANAGAIMGYVILDWTNFLNGYESGRRKRLHVFTPIGLGMSMMFGAQRKVDVAEYPVGTLRRNLELAFDLAIGVEYEASQEAAVYARASLFGSESTWDWSPYNNSYSIFDLIPSITAGVKFNFIHYVHKVNPYTGRAGRVKTFHEFQTVGSQHDLVRREVTIRHLGEARDSLDRLLDNLTDANDSLRAEMQMKYDSVVTQRDSLDNELQQMRGPLNIMQELAEFNAERGLPATIVYYQLDRYEIDYNGRRRLQNFAKDVQKLPDTLQFFVIGAADSATGTVRHNQWLSERRSEAALEMLVERFGVKREQLVRVSVGGIMEYDPKEFNRMAFIILRTPETEKIVERWSKKK